MFRSFFVYYSRTVTPFPVSFLWISYCCAFKIKKRAFKTNCTYTFLLTRDISLFPNYFQITSKMLHRVNAKIVTINRYMCRYVQLTSQGEGKYNEQHKAKTLSVHFAACKTYSD